MSFIEDKRVKIHTFGEATVSIIPEMTSFPSFPKSKVILKNYFSNHRKIDWFVCLLFKMINFIVSVEYFIISVEHVTLGEF